jgi:copper chaperone
LQEDTNQPGVFPMSQPTTHNYTVLGMTCGHCVNAVTAEVGALPGVSGVLVDLDSKIVSVTGENLDDAAIRAAIDEAGFEASA